jgi:hypothetical protein
MTSDDVSPGEEGGVDEVGGDASTGNSAADGPQARDGTARDEPATGATASDELVEGYRLLDRNRRLRTALLYATVFVSVLYVALLGTDLVSGLIRRSFSWGLFSLLVSVPFFVFGAFVRRLGTELAALTEREESLAIRAFPPDETPEVVHGTFPVDEAAGLYFLGFLLFAGVGVLNVVVGLLG